MSFWTGRRVFAAAAWLLAAGVAGWVVVVVAVARAGATDQARAADAIAVLGAAQYNGRPSPVFRARLDHAVALYRAGLAPVVLITGGVGRRDTLSEAEVGRRYLAAAGLPDEATIALPAGTDTYASLAEVAGWFRGRGSQRVVLVSDAFHCLRIRLLAQRLGLEPYTSPAPDSPIRANRRQHTSYVLAEGVKVPLAWLVQR